VPGPATERLAALARDHAVWLVIGVDEREPHGGTIYYLYAQGAVGDAHPGPGDGWIATMRHIARENRMFVVGVNPVLPRRLHHRFARVL
jgi:predicted amidohydrolase